MVLDEATLSSDNGFPGDGSPPDSEHDTQSRYEYDLTNLHQAPFTIPYFAPPRDARVEVDALLAHLSKRLQRRLSEPEVEVIVRGEMRTRALYTYGTIAGTAVASYRLYQLSNICTVPGINLQKSGFSLDKFGPLRGMAARSVWQGFIRFPLYYFAFTSFGGGLGGFTGLGMFTRDMQHNVILKDVKEVYLRRPSPPRGQSPNQRKSERLPTPVASRAGNDTNQNGREDHSPNTGVLTDAQRTQYERAAAREAEVTAQTKAPSRNTQYDDASPTGGLGSFGFGDESEKSSTATSAWDRIRQQSSSGQPPPKAQASRAQPRPQAQQSTQIQQPPAGRSEAQQEFDRQLEIERQGAGSDAENKRWR